MEVRTLLVVLLGRYRFELDPAMGGAEMVRRNMIMSLTLKIKGGLRLWVTKLGGGGSAVAAGNPSVGVDLFE